MAKRILKRTDFSIVNKSSYSHTVPEFAVDMSRIFDFHVLGFLRRHFQKKSIFFQVDAGIMGRCDYIVPSEKLIIDAKYKSNYTSKKVRSLELTLERLLDIAVQNLYVAD